jgi:hypothetical protein
MAGVKPGRDASPDGAVMASVGIPAGHSEFTADLRLFPGPGKQIFPRARYSRPIAALFCRAGGMGLDQRTS